jgi:hypothetical protein
VYYSNSDAQKGAGSIIVSEKVPTFVVVWPFVLAHKYLWPQPPGISLQSIYKETPMAVKEVIAAQVARWAIELFNLRFDSIGSLREVGGSAGFEVGPISTDIFNVDGRAKLAMLDRGPWKTVKEYFLACAQRELDCLRVLFTQDASEQYKKILEENQVRVERSMSLLIDIVNKCQGLDDDDSEFAPFALDTQAFEPESIYVSPGDPSKIVRRSTPLLWRYTS